MIKVIRVIEYTTNDPDKILSQLSKSFKDGTRNLLTTISVATITIDCDEELKNKIQSIIDK